MNETDLLLARNLAAKSGVTLLYKHATPVIVEPISTNRPAQIFTYGSLVQAKARSGDVLAGVAAAHGAIGYDAVQAALRAQALLARSAAKAALFLGRQAVVASDLIHHLL